MSVGNKLKKPSKTRFNLRRLGASIRLRRQEMDMSQEDLAALCRLHRTYISGIERGVRNPTITCIFDVSKALKLSLAELLQLTEAH